MILKPQIIKELGDVGRVIIQIIDGMSDNFKVYKEAKLANKSDEIAAFETWTGKQAKKNGFTKAKVITDDTDLVLIEFIK